MTEKAWRDYLWLTGVLVLVALLSPPVGGRPSARGALDTSNASQHLSCGELRLGMTRQTILKLAPTQDPYLEGFEFSKAGRATRIPGETLSLDEAVLIGSDELPGEVTSRLGAPHASTTSSLATCWTYEFDDCRVEMTVLYEDWLFWQRPIQVAGVTLQGWRRD